MVSCETKWRISLPKAISEIHKGLVLQLANSNEIPNGKFDQFMFDEGIFSHAITGNQMMRFTKRLSIKDNIKSYRQIIIRDKQKKLAFE